MRELVSSMKKPLTFLWFVLAPVLFFAVLYFLRQGERDRNADLVIRLRDTMTNNLVGIVITPDQRNREEWQVLVREEAELEAFRKMALNANPQPVSGHSGPIGEWTIMIQFASGQQLRYAASVHENEPEDLFLADRFYFQNRPITYNEAKGRRACLPGLGPWLMRTAPEGIFDKGKVYLERQ